MLSYHENPPLDGGFSWWLDIRSSGAVLLCAKLRFSAAINVGDVWLSYASWGRFATSSAVGKAGIVPDLVTEKEAT